MIFLERDVDTDSIFRLLAGEPASAGRPEGGLSKRALSLEGVPPSARSTVNT